MGDPIQEHMADIKAYQQDAKRRKQANRAMIDTGYNHLMGQPLDPQDHPTNNVSHPHGNRGRMDATLPPLSQPSNQPSSLSIDDF